MKENIIKKIFRYILIALDAIFGVFNYAFKGIGIVGKYIWKGVSYVFITVGKGVNFIVEKAFKPVLKAIANVFRRVSNSINKLYIKITSGKNNNKGDIKEGSKPKNFMSRFLSTKMTYHKRQALWGYVFITPLIIGFIYFFLFPFITTVVFSFSNIYRAGVLNGTKETLGVVTEWVGFDNYKFIWNVHSTFKETLGNVFVDTLLNVVLILIFSLIIAVVLNSNFKGRSFVRAIFFMPVIFNSQAVELAMSKGSALTDAMEQEGQNVFSAMFNFADFLTEANLPVVAVNFLTNASDSIFDVISYSGVQILIFLSAIQSVPKHLYEAAKIEGATQYEIFWKITFPMVSPLMLTAGVYTVVDSFLRSELLTLMDKYSIAGNTVYTLGLGDLTNDGVYAAMSMLFCLVSLAVVIIVIIAIRKLVFYHDE
ncbi:MAG: sugar ABC transporter permease [Bacilli bacterium]|nr:sugar ABC transporter permease [Bacilli bacterium]